MIHCCLNTGSPTTLILVPSTEFLVLLHRLSKVVHLVLHRVDVRSCEGKVARTNFEYALSPVYPVKLRSTTSVCCSKALRLAAVLVLPCAFTRAFIPLDLFIVTLAHASYAQPPAAAVSYSLLSAP